MRGAVVYSEKVTRSKGETHTKGSQIWTHAEALIQAYPLLMILMSTRL
jgi:hypothetical protein